MSDRYWVGGQAAWTSANTANWSTSSGGPGGAPVPTAADDVHFDANSGTGVVTATGTASCLDLDFTGYAGQFALNTQSAVLNVAGSLTLQAGMLFHQNGGAILFTAPGPATITSHGVKLGGLLSFNGVGPFTLLDGLTSLNPSGGGASLNLVAGELDTNGQAVTIDGEFANSGSGTRTLRLGASTITCSSWWMRGPAAGFILDAGTSTIVVTDANSTELGFEGAGLSYDNATIQGIATADRVMGLTGANTFANLTVNSALAVLSDDQTIAGTLTIANGSLKSNTPGTQRTVSAGAVSLNKARFTDIAAAGAAVPWSGTGLVDGGDNSGITF